MRRIPSEASIQRLLAKAIRQASSGDARDRPGLFSFNIGLGAITRFFRSERRARRYATRQGFEFLGLSTFAQVTSAPGIVTERP